MDFDRAHRLVRMAVDAVATVLKGESEVIELLMASILASGHALLEDVPGVGKTTLARSAAAVLGCSFSRIQFTADMLPGDILGVQVLNPREGTFDFKKGPIFAELVLADEINRASPKTQSAMLEAMAERRVTLDESRYELPQVFAVVATQNPVEHHGAYPLPESQLDRFMVRLSLGYPSRADERSLILQEEAPESLLQRLEPVLDPGDVRGIQVLAERVKLGEPLADYILALVEGSRKHPEVLLGCSPRGSLAFAAIARTWALLCGRDYVLPDDVKRLAEPVLAHRILVAGNATQASGDAGRALVDELLARTPVPR